jgi:hypothetical protein
MGFEPGGMSEKLGNRYEGRWVAQQLLRLLNEEIHSVTVEAIGNDEEGVDLWIEKNDGIRQAQQCKARNGSREFWSISDLKSRGILSHLKTQLDSNPKNEFAIISGIGSTTFHDICESARRFSNNDPEDFYNYQIQGVGEERRQMFLKFCEVLALDSHSTPDRAKAFDYLRRTQFNLYIDDRQDLQSHAGYLLTGNPDTVVSVLMSYPESNNAYRSPIYADILRKYMATQGIYPKLLAHDERIAPVIEELKQQFEESISSLLISGTLITRDETGLLLGALEEKKDVILHGTAGYGKSAVIYELTRHLQQKDIPFLPIRLDHRDPRNNAFQFGKDMDLPDSPAYCLASLAGTRQCVLILDQLDAIRWTCTHSSNALDVCKELMRQVRSLRKSGKRIVVVLSCRTYDLENDPEIKNWLRNQTGQDFFKVEVKAFSREMLDKVIGPSASQMTEHQKQILTCPQNLAMWMDLQSTTTAPDFRSATELMRRFWQNRRMVLERAGISSEHIDAALLALVDHMEHQGKISAPGRILGSWPTAAEAMSSYGIIQKSADGHINFCHQSYLDYLIADRLLGQIGKGTGSVITWLGSKERQSLFRREQLRQALAMLSEEMPVDFLRVAQELLGSENVRFHLKHLVLELIGQIDNINEEIGNYCLGLLNDNQWKEHVLETVFCGHGPYVSLLIEKGHMTEWINSPTEEDINRALFFLRSVNEKIPDAVAELIEPFTDKGGNWPVRILDTICWNPTDDSERMFQLRLQLARIGTVSNFLDWKSFCAKHPLRAFRLIEALASTWDRDSSDDERDKAHSAANHSRMENWTDDDITALNNATENYPAVVWDLFVPHIERLAVFEAKPYDRRLEKWQEDGLSGHKSSYTEIARGIVQLVITAGRSLLAKQPQELLTRTASLENSRSCIIQEILISVYAHLSASHADIGIRWLLADPNRLHMGSGYNEPEWMPAVRIIKTLSPHCSTDLFQGLEEAIVHYYSPEEKRLAEYYLKGWHDGFFGDYWGRAQHFLLPVLDSTRVQPSTINLIAVLKRKFENYSEERFLKTGRGTGGWIGSKLDASLEKISDRAWLKIINNDRIPKDSHKWKQIDHDHAVVSSIEQFSRSLGVIAARFPERFGRLALQLPENVHPQYVSAILSALGQGRPKSDIPEKERSEWRPASVKMVEDVLARFQSGDDRETAISFCRLIQERAEEDWSDKVIERLISYGMKHADPEQATLNIHCDKKADEASVHILFQNTINCVRGVAAEAIGSLLWNHTEWLDKLKPGISSLVNDPHPAVRMASINALLPVLNIDSELAVAWFCKACERDLRVAASPRAVFFFNHTVESHFEQIAPIIKAMVSSPLDDVSQEGAKEVAARWLFYGIFEEELGECRTGNIPQRKGIAEIAAGLLNDAKYSKKCQELLLPLFHDPEKEVRAETLKMMRGNMLPDGLAKNSEFMKAYIRSEAFTDNPSVIVHNLKELSGSLIPLDEIIFTVCEVFSTTLREKSREAGSHIPYTISQVCSLLLRLYEQAIGANNIKISNHCMDVWDMLFKTRVGIIRQLTAAIEK